jgi:clan AA aspartic protease (TIGR02281 family)
MEIIGRKLVSRVRLQGKRFTVFEDALIDTGAAFTVIPPETAEFLELETDKDFPKAKLVTASGIIETPVRVLEKLEIADQEVRELQVVVHRIPDPAPIKLLLGMNLIEKMKLIVDGKSNEFRLEDPI